MKNSIALLFFIFSSLFFAGAQTNITISGQITESNSNTPVDSQEVIIVTDTIYSTGGGNFWYIYNVVYTNSNGYYSSTISIPQTVTSCKFFVYTNDCTNITLSKALNYPSNSYKADFSVCKRIIGSCQAMFLAYPDALSPLTFNFIDVSKGTPTSWAWDFGDSTNSNSQNPTHTYSQHGTYTVTLSIVDYVNSCSDTYYYTLTTNSQSCKASFTYVTDSVNSDTYHFTAGKSSSNNVSYVWDFGDSSIGYGQYITHKFKGLLTYYVCLTVIDSLNNCFDTYCEVVRVGHGGCVSSFNYFDSNLTVFYISDNFDPGNIYTWDFGDGTTLTDTNFYTYHTYASSGSYHVCLTVTGSGVKCIKYCEYIYVGNTSNRGFISGFVYANNNFADDATVYLISYNPLDTTLSAIDSTLLDSNGIYYFTDVLFGPYLIKAALNSGSSYYSNYIPTYFDTALFWYDAQFVSVNQMMPTVMLDIHLIAGTNPGGPGFIGGKVTKGPNYRSDELEKLLVILLNGNDQPIAYTYSDKNGQFSFDNLAYGAYKVYVEIPGKTCDPMILTLSETNEEITDVEFKVSRYNVFSSIHNQNIDLAVNISDPYPNPANNSIQLDITLAVQKELMITVFNSLGETINISTFEANIGQNQFKIVVNSLKQGIYFLKITDNNGSALTKTFIKQ